MKYIVDRIEGMFAVCEDENCNMVNIPLTNLPKEIEERMVLYYSKEHYFIDEKEHQERSNRIKNKMNNLWN